MNKIKKNITVDYFYRFFASFDITAAIWILYLGYKGMNLIEIGLLESIFHITGLIFEIPTGAFADLLGRKKVIIFGRIGFLISCIIMLFSNSFLGFAASFITQAISYNLNSGSEEALVYDSLKEIGDEKNYTKIAGRLNLIIEIAQGLAVFIGGILSEINFSISYIVAILVGLCSLGISLKFKEIGIIEKKERIDKVNIIDHFKISFKILKNNKLLLRLLIYFPLIFTFSSTTYFYAQQYFRDLGLSKILISIIFLINGVFSALGALISDRFEKFLKGNRYMFIPLGIGISIILISCLEVVLSILMFWLLGIFTAMLYPISSNKVNSIIPSKQRATIISIDSMMFSIGMIVFFPLAGVIGENFNLRCSFFIIGIFVLLVSFMNFYIVKKLKN